MKSLPCVTLLFCFFVLMQICPAGAWAAATDKAATIYLPEEVIYRAISDALPIPLEQANSPLDGDFFVTTLDSLEINEKSILFKGVLTAENLSMNAKVAGQDINMKLGRVDLPVICELFLRFEPVDKILYLQPRFHKPGGGQSDLGDLMAPVLTALGDKEFSVDLGSIAPFPVLTGEENLSLRLEPVDLRMRKDKLILKLRPRLFRGK